MGQKSLMGTLAVAMGIACMGAGCLNTSTGNKTGDAKMNEIPYVTLNNGARMPKLGVGTFLVTGEDAVKRVKHAIDLGYRMIDTAQGYGNEAEVGQAIKESGIDRNELFITTKVAPNVMREGKVRQSLDESLSKLGTDYIDLVLIHWPVKDHVEETWKILEEYVDKGKIRSIGLSNFNPHHIDSLLGYARIKPVINQIEIHPYMTQPDVVKDTFGKGIQVESWGPLGQGITGELSDPVIRKIAEKHNKSNAQVILRWHMQRGLVTMPRCDNPDYTAENMQIFDFELSPAEMETISGLNKNLRANAKNDPDNFPW